MSRLPGGLHHLEIWVADLPAAERSWGWLLARLGYEVRDRWPDGVSWSRGDGPYVVVDCGAETVEMHRDPGPDGYREVSLVSGAATLRPKSFPDVELRTTDIFA